MEGGENFIKPSILRRNKRKKDADADVYADGDTDGDAGETDCPENKTSTKRDRETKRERKTKENPQSNASKKRKPRSKKKVQYPKGDKPAVPITAEQIVMCASSELSQCVFCAQVAFERVHPYWKCIRTESQHLEWVLRSLWHLLKLPSRNKKKYFRKWWVKTLQGKEVLCLFCEVTFASEEALQKHLETVQCFRRCDVTPDRHLSLLSIKRTKKSPDSFPHFSRKLPLVNFGKCYYGHFVSEELWNFIIPEQLQRLLASKQQPPHIELRIRKEWEETRPKDLFLNWVTALMRDPRNRNVIWGITPLVVQREGWVKMEAENVKLNILRQLVHTLLRVSARHSRVFDSYHFSMLFHACSEEWLVISRILTFDSYLSMSRLIPEKAPRIPEKTRSELHRRDQLYWAQSSEDGKSTFALLEQTPLTGEKSNFFQSRKSASVVQRSARIKEILIKEDRRSLLASLLPHRKREEKEDQKKSGDTEEKEIRNKDSAYNLADFVAETHKNLCKLFI